MKNERWNCIQGCGACCRIEPVERQEALEVLSETQVDAYLDMVGDNGWCRHYDHSTKTCRIYKERPDFCRVSKLPKLFGIPDTAAGAFAIQCCRDQIRSIYGGRSNVKKIYGRRR